jgi:hypothetical protein
MEKLRVWLKRRGFDLNISPGLIDSVCFDSQIVSIDSRMRLDSKLSTLLHECGHVEVLFSRVRNPKKRFGGATLKEWLKNNMSGVRPTKHSKICNVAEEIEAWDRGELLAKKLNLRLRMKTFRCVRTRALLTYVRDAA